MLNDRDITLFGDILDTNGKYLNDEVEIIEDDKKIEKLELYTFSSGNLEMLIELLNDLNREHVNKINEIIDYINTKE